MNSGNPRNLLWALPLLLLLGTPLWKPPLTAFLAPRGDAHALVPPPPPAEGTPAQNFIMDNVHITVIKAGREEWQIEAERAWSGPKDNEIEMLAVHARSTSAAKDPITITSKRGLYDTASRHLTLKDQVVLTNTAKNQQFFSDQLHYDEGAAMVRCPGQVRLVTPNLDLQAGGMDYDLSTGAYDFGKRVHVLL